MDTHVIKVDPRRPDPDAIGAAARIIREGGLVAFATETVYGLGANAFDPGAVGKIYEAKGRPAADPIIVHIAALDQLNDLVTDMPDLAHQLAREFWPGPLTLVMRRHPNVSSIVSAGRETVAVRMPNHAVPQALIKTAGTPIAAPSANLFSRPSATSARHVLDDLGGRVDLILDSGSTTIGLESTVIDLTTAAPTILRPGGVPVESLRRFAPTLEIAAHYLHLDSGAAAASPGLLKKHYSPRAAMRLFTGPFQRVISAMRQAAHLLMAEDKKVGVLVPDEDQRYFADLQVQMVLLGPRADLSQIGSNLFAAIRELDKRGVDVILVRGLGNTGLGLAIWDRLIRASEGNVVDVTDMGG
jgi:L-threonylcarbamoyladenylate synthase